MDRVDVTGPIEGAGGGILAVLAYLGGRSIVTRLNGSGKRNKYPCAQHGERLKGVEVQIQSLASLVNTLATGWEKAQAFAQTSQAAFVEVQNEQGQRIALLEATGRRMEDGIVAITISIDRLREVLVK